MLFVVPQLTKNKLKQLLEGGTTIIQQTHKEYITEAAEVTGMRACSDARTPIKVHGN